MKLILKATDFSPGGGTVSYTHLDVYKRQIVDAGIPVVGHIGLLPQKVLEEGGYKIKGKSSTEEEALVRDVRCV